MPGFSGAVRVLRLWSRPEVPNTMVDTWDHDFEPEATGARVTMEHHSRALWGKPPPEQARRSVHVQDERSVPEAAKERLETAAT